MTNAGAAVVALAIVGAAAWWALRDQAANVDADWIDSAEFDNAPDWTDYGAQAVDMAQEIFESGDMNNNLAAFLQAIRYGEGTSGANGYATLCGGDLFDSYEAHPASRGWRGLPLSDSMCAGAGYGPGCVSTAAGAYQINRPTWNRLQGSIGFGDFSPARQDAAAIQLIKEKGALADVQAGRIASAVNKCKKIWASLPGAGYGQHEVGMATFQNKYINAGGVVA